MAVWVVVRGVTWEFRLCVGSGLSGCGVVWGVFGGDRSGGDEGVVGVGLAGGCVFRCGWMWGVGVRKGGRLLWVGWFKFVALW